MTRSAELVEAHFDLRPGAIIERLNLRRPIFRQVVVRTAISDVRTSICPGSETDLALSLREAAGIKIDEATSLR